jgi:hypothetical protein
MNNEKQSFSETFWQRFANFIFAPALRSTFLTAAMVMAGLAPFLGVRWAACSAAAGIVVLAITSLQISVALSGIWQSQVGSPREDAERAQVNPKTLSIN